MAVRMSTLEGARLAGRAATVVDPEGGAWEMSHTLACN